MTHCCLSGILFMTHCRFHGGFLWRITIFDASYIWRILIFVQYIHNMWVIFSEFLCKMLYVCSVFYMIFVQFLGVIKCLNNPFFTMCRIAHTKKPHIKNFLEFPNNSDGVHQEHHLMQFLPKIAQAQVGHVLLSCIILSTTLQPYTSHVYP